MMRMTRETQDSQVPPRDSDSVSLGQGRPPGPLFLVWPPLPTPVLPQELGCWGFGLGRL